MMHFKIPHFEPTHEYLKIGIIISLTVYDSFHLFRQTEHTLGEVKPCVNVFYLYFFGEHMKVVVVSWHFKENTQKKIKKKLSYEV